MEKLKVLELFGGIGACSRALDNLKIPYEIADYVEIDQFATKSYNAIHNTNFKPQDIREWDKNIDVDLIMHGSPCQDFSLAGLQKGGDEGSGTRSSLMYETLRIVKKLKPKYVIWENVKNLISEKHYHNFDNYLLAMQQIGYDNYYKVLNAKDYEIPQNRERVFTISIRSDLHKGYEFPKPKELKIFLKDLLEKEVDESYYLDNNKIKQIMSWNSNQRPLEHCMEKKSIMPTMTTVGVERTSGGMFIYSDQLENTTNLEKELINKKIILCSTLIANNTVKEGDIIRHSYSQDRMENQTHIENRKSPNLSATLTSRPDTLGIVVKESNIKSIPIKNATKQGYLLAEDGDGIDISYRMDTHRGTVQKGMSQTIKTQQDVGVCVDNLRIRKLTPKECWRLMGFDDEAFERAEKVNSRTQLYRQAGNSIVVNVLMAILTELLLKEHQVNIQMNIFDF